MTMCWQSKLFSFPETTKASDTSYSIIIIIIIAIQSINGQRGKRRRRREKKLNAISLFVVVVVSLSLDDSSWTRTHRDSCCLPSSLSLSLSIKRQTRNREMINEQRSIISVLLLFSFIENQGSPSQRIRRSFTPLLRLIRLNLSVSDFLFVVRHRFPSRTKVSSIPLHLLAINCRWWSLRRSEEHWGIGKMKDCVLCRCRRCLRLLSLSSLLLSLSSIVLQTDTNTNVVSRRERLRERAAKI